MFHPSYLCNISRCFMLSVNIFFFNLQWSINTPTSLVRFNSYKLSHSNTWGIQLYIIWLFLYIIRFDNQGYYLGIAEGSCHQLCVTIFGVLERIFPLSFCITMSDFRYHYLSASLYLFAILVIIVENDLGNKNFHVLNISNTLCIQFFPYYYLII